MAIFSPFVRYGLMALGFAGAATAVMLIRETNAPARKLAERAGFELVAEDPCSRLSAVPRLLYAKPLETPALLPA